MVDTSLRELLRAAIEQRAVAQSRLDENKVAVGRAHELLEWTTSCLAGFSGLDAKIAAFRAAALADLLKSGDESLDIVMPSDLVIDQRQKAGAERDVADATAAHAKLSAEVETAARELSAAEEQVRQLAVQVIRAEAHEAAHKLLELQRAAFMEKLRLRGLGTVYVSLGGAMKAFPMPVSAVNAVNAKLEPYEDILPGPNGPEAQATTQWREYYAALLTDSEATL